MNYLNDLQEIFMLAYVEESSAYSFYALPEWLSKQGPNLRLAVELWPYPGPSISENKSFKEL
jgi:hypothetical protein